MKIVLLDGTEKEYVQTKEIITHLGTLAKNNHIDIETICLREKRISHCTLCFVCTNKKGTDPVKCFLEDGMDEVIDSIEKADAYIIITDRSSIFKRNKLFQKFSSRLLAYYYKPNKKEEPRRRKPTLTKNAIIINYNLTNFFTNYSFALAKYYLKKSSKAIGAKVIASLMITPAETSTKVWKKNEGKIEKLFKKLL